MLFIVILLDGFVINSPFLAYSYKGLPLCFSAEKKGGICIESPIRLSNIFFTSDFLGNLLDWYIIFPVESSVSVEVPSSNWTS